MVADFPATTDEWLRLKDELRKTRVAVEALIDEVQTINRRTTTNRVLAGATTILSVVLAVVVLYLGWYVNDQSKIRAEQRDADLALIENQFRTGCENAVNFQEDSREELLEFGRYLGTRNGLPPAEIDIALEEIAARLNSINPPRDCEAEADARAAERRERDS